MPISGLVLTLEPSEAERARTLALIARDPRITLGPSESAIRVPAVIETRTVDDAERLFESLQATPGVVFVDVVSLDFSDLENARD